MANEFSRTQTVSDYQIYQGRENTQVNWNQMSRGINQTFNKIAEDREARKKEIDDETDAVLNQLEKADAYNSQTMGDTVAMLANQMREQVTTLNGIVKRGGMRPNEFLKFIQKAKDNIANWGIAAKDWDSAYKVAEDRQKLGEDGVKIASGVETFTKKQLQAFGNLNNMVPWVSPKGNVYQVRMIEDENGNQIMPDYDTHPENYLPFSSVNERLNYMDDGNKYDTKTLIANNVDKIGTFITSYAEGYETLEGGGAVVTTEGARQMNALLKDENGEAYQAFNKLREGIVNEVVLTTLNEAGESDIPNVANILIQHGIGEFELAQSEEQFREMYPGRSLDKMIKVDYTTAPPTFTYTEEMIEAAQDHVRLQVESQVGYKRTRTEGKSGQQESAATTGNRDKIVKVGGFAAQIADALTADPANADTIVRGLITDINQTNANTELAEIVDYRIDDDEITFFREGDKPITLPRRSITGELDDPATPDINEAYTDVDLINEITGIYKSLTGEKGVNRTQIEEGLAEVEYNLSEKEKRAGTLQGGTPREAFGLITETDSINKDGDTVKSLIVDEFDGWFDGEGSTGGVIDWLARDSSSMRSINDVVMKALKPAVKRNIANNDELSNVSTSLIEDSKADQALAAWQQTEYGKKFMAENPNFLDGRDSGEEVVMIRGAGVAVPVLLDQGMSTGQVSQLITQAVNDMTQAVNAERSKTDNRRAKATKKLSVNELQAKTSYKKYLKDNGLVDNRRNQMAYKKFIIDKWNAQ